jgi:pimeloyl-ACP methyl ester carboxylesterase
MDDVLLGLSIARASLAGMSLGGWLALDYATRRPERVESLALLSPGGVGRQKAGIIFKAVALRLCGSWGSRKLREGILGRLPGDAPRGVQAFFGFLALIQEHFRPRTQRLPLFRDDALQRLTMPVMAVVGDEDALLDSAGTRRRLERNVPHAVIRYLQGTGHLIPPQTAAILEFLCREKAAG